MKKTLFSTIAAIALLTGCAAQQENTQAEAAATEAAPARINDFPTRDRVEYVLECMAKRGGSGSYITQYACGCKVDKIAEKLTFAEYEAARTYTQMQKAPGESGAAFRDAKQSKDLRAKLKEADAEAEKACFVK